MVIPNACNLEGIKFNMLRYRHQFSTDLIKNGKDVRTIMELMGHNNIEMPFGYARSDEQAKINALLEK